MGMPSSKYLVSWIHEIPIVGHFLSFIYYLQDKKELAAEAFKSASHNTGTVCLGVVGGLSLGPIGAVVGGIAGGIAIDTLISALSSKCYGYNKYAKKMWNRNMTLVDWMYLVILAIKDGLIGLAAYIIYICIMELPTYTRIEGDYFKEVAEGKCYKQCPKPQSFHEGKCYKQCPKPQSFHEGKCYKQCPKPQSFHDCERRNLMPSELSSVFSKRKEAKRIHVERISQLQPGDHIMFPRCNTGKSNLYEHHGIVGKVFEKENMFTIYEQSSNTNRFNLLWGKASIKENIKSFDTKSMYIIDHGEEGHTNSVTEEIAHYICYHSSVLDFIKTYNLLLNNCEHFANFCATGIRKSYQSEWLVGYLVKHCSDIREVFRFVFTELISAPPSDGKEVMSFIFSLLLRMRFLFLE